jgi:hypothetical protein
MNFGKNYKFIVLALVILGNFAIVDLASAAIELVKLANSDAVYYLNDGKTRHAFPNKTTFASWFDQEYSKVITVSESFLTKYPLGKNVTIRPGSFLVKITTSPQVYAIEEGGVLREIVSEQVAEKIYGKDWAKRVVDVPDVFFSDYQIGKPITHDFIIPDNVLLKNEKNEYLYKRFDAVQKFSAVADIVANNLKPEEAIYTTRGFVSRERPISGKQKNFNLVITDPLYGALDCENKNLKAATIFLSNESYDPNEITAVEKIKNLIPDRFNWVSHDFANIDVSYPTAKMPNDGYLIKQRTDGTYDINTETLYTFYDQHPDDFDFVIIWTNFATPSDNTNEIARFIPVTNALEGNGKQLLDRAAAFGSKGKLKGVILMGNINKYETVSERGMNQTLNYVMHEILHQWSAYIKFKDETGEYNDSLLRQDDFSHWSYYAGFISPLGGSGWVDNQNGTFTSTLATLADTGLRRYSILDLYAMGHIPRQLMPDIFYVEPNLPGDTGNVIPGKSVSVSIDQIVASHGEIRCTVK